MFSRPPPNENELENVGEQEGVQFRDCGTSKQMYKLWDAGRRSSVELRCRKTISNHFWPLSLSNSTVLSTHYDKFVALTFELALISCGALPSRKMTSISFNVMSRPPPCEMYTALIMREMMKFYCGVSSQLKITRLGRIRFRVNLFLSWARDKNRFH